MLLLLAAWCRGTVDHLAGVPLGALEAVDSELQQTWGGAEGYCRSIGITAAEIRVFRESMLE